MVADDPTAARGLPVLLNTYGEDYRNLTKHLSSGFARAVTDSEGWFRVPALATGTLFAAVQVPEESPHRALSIKDRPFNASSRTELEIPLIRMIHVRGLVRDAETKKPIEGVGVSFSSPDLVSGVLKFVKTDANGRYKALSLILGRPLTVIFPSRVATSNKGAASRPSSARQTDRCCPPSSSYAARQRGESWLTSRLNADPAVNAQGQRENGTELSAQNFKDSPGMMMGANYSARRPRPMLKASLFWRNSQGQQRDAEAAF